MRCVVGSLSQTQATNDAVVSEEYSTAFEHHQIATCLETRATPQAEAKEVSKEGRRVPESSPNEMILERLSRRFSEAFLLSTYVFMS